MGAATLTAPGVASSSCPSLLWAPWDLLGRFLGPLLPSAPGPLVDAQLGGGQASHAFCEWECQLRGMSWPATLPWPLSLPLPPWDSALPDEPVSTARAPVGHPGPGLHLTVKEEGSARPWSQQWPSGGQTCSSGSPAGPACPRLSWPGQASHPLKPQLPHL